jgi:hypothetical protein
MGGPGNQRTAGGGVLLPQGVVATAFYSFNPPPNGGGFFFAIKYIASSRHAWIKRLLDAADNSLRSPTNKRSQFCALQQHLFDGVIETIHPIEIRISKDCVNFFSYCYLSVV